MTSSFPSNVPTERRYIYASVVTTVDETTAEDRHVVAGVAISKQ